MWLRVPHVPWPREGGANSLPAKLVGLILAQTSPPFQLIASGAKFNFASSPGNALILSWRPAFPPPAGPQSSAWRDVALLTLQQPLLIS